MAGKVERDELDTTAITAVGVVGAVLVFVIIVALQAWFAKLQQDEYRVKVVGARSEELAGVVADQEEQLHTYRWVDRAHGIVTIPIERAMELVRAREEAARQAALGAASPAGARP